MQILPTSLHIGVLRGGPSPEYDISLKSGANVLKHLSETHRPLDIFISRDGKWHMNGVERVPERILKNVDVVFNALHGAYGEDGGVQEILNYFGVPHTGSGRLESAISMNKWLTKERAISAGIKTPVFAIVQQTDSLEEKAKEIFNSIPHPLMVKPACGGSSLGLYKVDSFSKLLPALESVLSKHGSAIVEECIVGKDFSCTVTDDFRGQNVYVFPPTGLSDAVKISKEETKTLENIAKNVHEILNLSHYSKSDFIVSSRRGIYFLEVNTTPKLRDNSSLFKSLESVGAKVKDFLDHIISLALNKKG